MTTGDTGRDQGRRCNSLAGGRWSWFLAVAKCLSAFEWLDSQTIPLPILMGWRMRRTLHPVEQVVGRGTSSMTSTCIHGYLPNLRVTSCFGHWPTRIVLSRTGTSGSGDPWQTIRDVSACLTGWRQHHLAGSMCRGRVSEGRPRRNSSEVACLGLHGAERDRPGQ